MFQQSILDSLRSLFGNMEYGDISGITGEDIASRIAATYGLEQEDLPAAMFQTISPEMLAGGMYQTYSPQLQAKGQSLLSGLRSGLGGQKAKQAAGGFAGSGGQSQFQSGIKDVYGREMTGAITDVSQQRMQGLGNISDIINQWKQTGQRIAYGG
tara:strand:+ start:281 stop:745 length:465 start_codon:yes stop_codon:yes gene_type:complete